MGLRERTGRAAGQEVDRCLEAAAMTPLLLSQAHHSSTCCVPTPQQHVLCSSTVSGWHPRLPARHVAQGLPACQPHGLPACASGHVRRQDVARPPTRRDDPRGRPTAAIGRTMCTASAPRAPTAAPTTGP